MHTIKKICKITGKEFEISEHEQRLREKFGVGLPDVSPQERLRYLMMFRNVCSLYSDTCDLCKKHILSIWGEKPVFPVYCKECWYSDKWKPVEFDVDVNKPFFSQFKKLVDTSPHPARSLIDPIENSEFSNGAVNIKNCYLCFNVGDCEDCAYCCATINDKNCFDLILTDNGEFLYDCVACHDSYQVFWSEFAIHCSESYFLYDCTGCTNCALSTGLRRQQFVFLNKHLTENDYRKKIKDLQTGSYRKLQQYKEQYEVLKKKYAKKYIAGHSNEDSSGNLVYNAKDVENGYHVSRVENAANLVDVWDAKDCLDMVSFGFGTELCYQVQSTGTKAHNIRSSCNCYNNTFNVEYCWFAISSNNCFGSGFGRKMEYRILNKQYSQEEYSSLKSRIIEKMKERGEYGKVFPKDLIPFPYNDTVANFIMPLSKEEVESRGFKWAEKAVPKVPEHMKYIPVDNIADVSWSDVDGKAVLCEKSGKPFKITRMEFDFYKKFNIPLPRIHPDVRLVSRYPSELMFNIHKANCNNCGMELETSMPKEDKVLCEKCYQEAVQ